MDALSRLNSEFRRNTKKHRVLAQDQNTYLPRWLSAGVTLPSPLFIPLEHGKPWMVEFLIKQHPHLLDVEIAPGWGSPLIFAIAKNPDCLSILLKAGVDLNKLYCFKPKLYGQYILHGSHTPISWAALTGSEVALDFLLSRTEVDIPNDILHKAVMPYKPSHEAIRKFRQRGADINCTVKGSTPIHRLLTQLSNHDKSQLLPVVKALVEPSCNLSLQDWTARTILHIALDARLEDIVTYLLEKNAGLSATATPLPDMWSRAANMTWFSKVQAAAVAADQPYTRIKGKVVDATAESETVEFPVAVTAARGNPNPICAAVVSAIVNGELCSFIRGNLSYCNQSFQNKVQELPTDDPPRPELNFSWQSGQRVSSRLFDYHQGPKVTRMLRQLTKDKNSTNTSLILKMFKQRWNSEVFQRVDEFTLDIYRGPLP